MKRTLLALALVAPAAFAQRVNSSSAASASDYSSTGSARAIAVGVRTTYFPSVLLVGDAHVTQIHAMFEVAPRFLVGAGFGFDSDFDVALFNGDVRYNFVKRGAAGMYGEAQFGWLRWGTANGFQVAALFGFNYALTDNLQVNTGYGLQLAFGDAAKSNFGFTQAPLGNFGVHWYF